MLDLKALLAKILNKFVVRTYSGKISTTAGSLVSAQWRRYGNIVQLYLGVRNTSATAVGANIYIGTITDTTFVPQMYSACAAYYGKFTHTISISASGTIVVRNSNSETFPSLAGTSNYVTVSITYIANGGGVFNLQTLRNILTPRKVVGAC